MRVVECGHIYELNWLDPEVNGPTFGELVFVNREKGTEHPGTQTQEVLRALIQRTQHCDRCLRWEGNDLIIEHLRQALVLHEMRALMRKTEKGYIKPELIETSDDGHFKLTQQTPAEQETKGGEKQ